MDDCMKKRLLIVYVLMLTKAGKERNVANKTKVFPGVTEVKIVYGKYDS